MYTYPIKLEFPFISIGRQVDVRNGDGRFIMRASDPAISFKDSMKVVDGNGKEVFQFNGDSSFRFLFQFASMSTEWNVQTPDGQLLAVVDDYWARMEEFQAVGVNAPSATDGNGMPSFSGIAGQFAANMVNSQISRTVPGRLVYKITDKKITDNVMGWVVPSRGTAWFDFLPYSTKIQILNIPFMARFYAPSYEFKIGSLHSPSVLKLQKQRDMFIDRYTLEKVGELTDAQERWAIPVLTLVTMFERTRVKQMADW